MSAFFDQRKIWPIIVRCDSILRSFRPRNLAPIKPQSVFSLVLLSVDGLYWTLLTGLTCAIDLLELLYQMLPGVTGDSFIFPFKGVNLGKLYRSLISAAVRLVMRLSFCSGDICAHQKVHIIIALLNQQSNSALVKKTASM